MGLTDVLFISATLVWLSEFVLFKGKQQEQTTVSLTEKKSFIAILLTILFCIGLCLLFQQMNWTRINQPAMIWVGLTVYGCGIVLRIWSMILLRGEFTRDVQTSKTMVLVSEGPYKYMRHPLYTGLLLCVLGISLYTQTVAGVALSLFFITYVLSIRIRLEERMLDTALAGAYTNWKKKRWILIPFLY